MRSMNLITQQQLKSLVIIRPETGECFNLKGQPLGSPSSKGYTRVTLLRREYRLHRLVWLWVHGNHPPDEMTIDHINEIKTDNRISNLRLATIIQNVNFYLEKRQNLDMRNIHKDGKSYRVEMLFNGKRIRKRAYTLAKAFEVREALFDIYPPIELR